MNSRYLLSFLCLAALTPAAKADKFYLGSEADAEKMSAGDPATIEGVILKEEKDRYLVRVEGGQIELLKANVYKIDTDGLTVAQLEQREDDSRQQLAEVDAQRSARMVAMADAELQRIRGVRTAEAAARVRDSLPAENVGVPELQFDPVLDVVQQSMPGVYNADYYIRKELGGIIRRRLDDAARHLR